METDDRFCVVCGSRRIGEPVAILSQVTDGDSAVTSGLTSGSGKVNLSTHAPSKKTRILITLVVVVATLGILAGVIVYHDHQSSQALKHKHQSSQAFKAYRTSSERAAMSSWARKFHRILGPYDQLAFTEVPHGVVTGNSSALGLCALQLYNASVDIAELENSPSGSINHEMMRWAHDTNAYSWDVQQFNPSITDSGILAATRDVKNIKKDMNTLTKLLNSWEARH
jgi:hypothetical protein